MKKFNLLLAVLIMTSSVIHSQSPDFVKLLDENMNFAVDMIQTTDGNFIIAGNNQSETNVFVVSVNSDGEILWSNFFTGEMLWYSRIAQKSNGNILIPMGDFNPILIELNNLGDSIGAISISESHKSFFNSVIEIQDSLVFVSEIIFNDDPFIPKVDSSYLVKISENGNVIERYLFKLKTIMDILPSPDNLLFVLFHPAISPNSYIAKYNLNGELLSSNSCSASNPYMNRLYESNNLSFYAVGYNMDKPVMTGALTKFDNDLQIEYCSGYNTGYFSSMANENFSENLYVLGDDNGHCIINRLNPSGGIVSVYQISDSLTGSTIISTENYVYIAGVNNYLTDPRVCFIKINQDSIFSGLIKNDFPAFKVYPNPSSNFVVFELELKYNPQIQYNDSFVEIYDITGNLVNSLLLKNGSVIWDARNVKSGVYFYKIDLTEFSKQGKIVIKN